MDKSTGKISIWKFLVPTFLGLGVVGYMFLKEFSVEDLYQIPLTWQTVFWIFVALCFMIGRDAGFTIRYRYLTEKALSWKQSLKITLLAEFGSAITPSIVGGSSMAVLFMAKEKIPVGKSTAMVFVTLLLDESFFVIVFPVLLLIVPFNDIFTVGNTLTNTVLVLFVGAYVVKVLLCLLLIIGLFVRPQLVRTLLIRIFRLPFLNKWHYQAVEAGDDIIISSKEIRGKKLSYWMPLILATILSWCSRYLVVNALFMAFFKNLGDNLLIFVRQFVMWVVMIISPTPGGSGISEFIFEEYLGDFIPVLGLLPVIILLWRLLTYYNYLFIGALLLPKWVSDKFGDIPPNKNQKP